MLFPASLYAADLLIPLLSMVSISFSSTSCKRKHSRSVSLRMRIITGSMSLQKGIKLSFAISLCACAKVYSHSSFNGPSGFHFLNSLSMRSSALSVNLQTLCREHNLEQFQALVLSSLFAVCSAIVAIYDPHESMKVVIHLILSHILSKCLSAV